MPTRQTKRDNDVPGPLDGVTVVDLTTMVSGPLATMTLADQGANVIKIESPWGGDYSRHVATTRGGFSASFLNNNRNKRSVVLDLKSDAGLNVLKRLVAEADVFVQNFRPGVAQRIGAGEASLRAVRPDLIYVSITGFGFEGPYANKPVFDPLIQALSGLTTVQAGSDDERPRLVRTIVPDKLTGIQTAQAVAAALFARQRTGQGQHIRISMLDTIIAFLWSSDMGGHTFVGDELGHETAQSYIDLIYETNDGYISIAVMQDKHWTGLATALQRADFLSDERFLTPALREINKDARVTLIQQAVRVYATAELLKLLEAHDVPCSPVLRRRDMINHPQVAANGIIEQHTHPQAGRLRQTRQPAQFSHSELEHRYSAPSFGAHTHEVLIEHGFTRSEIETLTACGALGRSAVENKVDD